MPSHRDQLRVRRGSQYVSREAVEDLMSSHVHHDHFEADAWPELEWRRLVSSLESCCAELKARLDRIASVIPATQDPSEGTKGDKKPTFEEFMDVFNKVWDMPLNPIGDTDGDGILNILEPILNNPNDALWNLVILSRLDKAIADLRAKLQNERANDQAQSSQWFETLKKMLGDALLEVLRSLLTVKASVDQHSLQVVARLGSLSQELKDEVQHAEEKLDVMLIRLSNPPTASDASSGSKLWEILDNTQFLRASNGQTQQKLDSVLSNQGEMKDMIAAIQPQNTSGAVLQTLALVTALKADISRIVKLISMGILVVLIPAIGKPAASIWDQKRMASLVSGIPGNLIPSTDSSVIQQKWVLEYTTYIPGAPITSVRYDPFQGAYITYTYMTPGTTVYNWRLLESTDGGRTWEFTDTVQQTYSSSQQELIGVSVDKIHNSVQDQANGVVQQVNQMVQGRVDSILDKQQEDIRKVLASNDESLMLSSSELIAEENPSYGTDQQEMDGANMLPTFEGIVADVYTKPTKSALSREVSLFKIGLTIPERGILLSGAQVVDLLSKYSTQYSSVPDKEQLYLVQFHDFFYEVKGDEITVPVTRLELTPTE